ncbi:hypothetical protein ACFQ0Q_02060 [Streptomyces aureus]
MLVDQLLATLGLKLGGLPEGTLAMMRSMLTDPAAADHVRVTLDRQIDSVSAALPAAEDPELRAALFVTALLGVTIGHHFSAWPLFAVPRPTASPPCCARRSRPWQDLRAEIGGAADAWCHWGGLADGRPILPPGSQFLRSAVACPASLVPADSLRAPHP